MATFVEVLSDRELESEMARFLSRLRTGGSSEEQNGQEKGVDEALIANKSPTEILRTFLAQTSTLLKSTTDKEFENFFFVIFNLVRKLDKENSKKVTEEAVDILVSTQPLAEKSLVRVRILGHVYNMFDSNPTSRGGYFLSLLEYANRSHHADLLLSQFKDVDKRIVEWGLSCQEKQRLYKHIRNTFRNANKGKDAYDWSVKYLSTFSEHVPSEDVDEAFTTCIESIRIPTVFRFDDLIQLNPIKKLRDHSNPLYQKAFTLLQIFWQESAPALQRFEENNPDILKTLVLDHDAISEKIRLLSIVTLALNNEEQENSKGTIPYSLLASTLSIDESQVEYYVVLAITVGIIDARIDQLNKIIKVTRALQRTFSTQQWKQLSDGLNMWTNNVKLLLKTLNECKQQAADA